MQNTTDKILVTPSAKGGVQSAMSIVELIDNGCGPKALFYNRTNPIMVKRAVIMNAPIMDFSDQNTVETMRSGDW